MGQSSGLPTSFTQRPYNYPELFVSILEVGIAGLVAAILNYFFQRPAAAKVRIVKSAVPAAPVGPIRVVPQAMTRHAAPGGGLAHHSSAGCEGGFGSAACSGRCGSSRRRSSHSSTSGCCSGAASSSRSGARCPARGNCPPSAGSRESCGSKAAGARGQGRTGQAQEGERGLLQHCWGTDALGRRLGLRSK